MAKDKTQGRPTKYTEELANYICDRISTSSDGLAKICSEKNIFPSTVYRWLEDNKIFCEMYARAREAQADYLADEILKIADDSSKDTAYREGVPIEDKEWVNRSRLRVDARKWIAAKLKPRKYGDKLDIDARITEEIEIIDTRKIGKDKNVG